MTRFAFISLLFLGVNSLFAQTGKVMVIIKGVQQEKGGEVSTGLFTKENFPIMGKQLKSIEAPVNSNVIQVLFENVPIGMYGIASFQDIDKNNKLNSNLIGIPTEPMGFSRDAKIKLGPPDFEDATVKIEPDKTTTVTITLKCLSFSSN